jgi:hypothetical protein
MTTDVPPVSIEEKPAADAAEFWRLLSPEKPLFPASSVLLYRGQANASWPLEPSILRHPENKLGVVFRANGEVASDDQVIKEWVYLSSFVRFCDSIGLAIPNDSPEFRKIYLDQPGPGIAFIQTTLWPDPILYGLLALAQHHGVPTRLLDWSTRSYVAAYFAISDALRNQKCTPESDRLAVWVLDVTRKGLYPNFETVKVPGGNNANLAAQAGMFTWSESRAGWRARSEPCAAAGPLPRL